MNDSNRQPQAARRRRWRQIGWLGAVLLLLTIASLAPYMTSSTELVRMRNALLFDAGSLAEFDWAPAAMPSDFLQDHGLSDQRFAATVRRLELDRLPSDWERAVAISRHLLGSRAVRIEGAIQSDLHDTHRQIVEEGRGYCADFVRAYSALAGAAGLTVRAWAFSFDGFGGHGHVWPEIWNRELQRWQLVDVFNNVYFVGAAGQPMSALELREALMPVSRLSSEAPVLPRMLRLDPAARPGFIHPDKAWDYYRRGLPEWYLWWGSNPFTYDAAWPVRAVGWLSRSLEQLAAIGYGVHPRLHVLATDANARQRAAFERLGWHLRAAAVLGVAALLLLLTAAIALRRNRLEDGSTNGPVDDDDATPGLPRVCVVGPLPPPPGGMANQCEQLVRLLRLEGLRVEVVRSNAPYRPTAAGHIPVLRAAFRLMPYLARLWQAAGRADVMHVLANSGWSWHLFAAPAMTIARLRGAAVIINYRGGNADHFLAHAPSHVLGALAAASLRVTPSDFLARVFARHGLDAEVIPNVIDLSRFAPVQRQGFGDAPHLIVTRNLEPIYDIATALRAFARIRARLPGATLTVAGTGPELGRLQQLAAELHLEPAVRFAGRIDNDRIAGLYARAHCMLNPSTVDNMPISVLEAFASGVAVVSTNAGGVPDIVNDGVNGLLVPIGDDASMARAALRILEDPVLAARLAQAGLAQARRYAWSEVRVHWLEAYRRAAAGTVAVRSAV